MSAILNSLNAHNFLNCQPILMTRVSKFVVYRALTDKTCLLLGLRSPQSYFKDKISEQENYWNQEGTQCITRLTSG